MKKVLLVLLVLVLCGCGNKETKKDVYQIMKENEHIIIDVRTKEEYDESHVVGAINIPYDEIDKDINLDKNKIIFVYCKSGKRSNIAYANLTHLGYTVYDLGAFSNVNLEKE